MKDDDWAKAINDSIDLGSSFQVSKADLNNALGRAKGYGVLMDSFHCPNATGVFLNHHRIKGKRVTCYHSTKPGFVLKKPRERDVWQDGISEYPQAGDTAT